MYQTEPNDIFVHLVSYVQGYILHILPSLNYTYTYDIRTYI